MASAISAVTSARRVPAASRVAPRSPSRSIGCSDGRRRPTSGANAKSSADASDATTANSRTRRVECHGDVAAEGQVAKAWREDDVDAARHCPREGDAGRAAEGRHEQAFHEDLPREMTIGGAERQPRDELAAPRETERELQAGDVDTRDQQHQRRRLRTAPRECGAC